MTLQSQQHRFPPRMDAMSPYPAHQQLPHFTNPWTTSSPAAPASVQTASPSLYSQHPLPGAGGYGLERHSSVQLPQPHHQNHQNHQNHQPYQQQQQPLPLPPVTAQEMRRSAGIAPYGAMQARTNSGSSMTSDPVYTGVPSAQQHGGSVVDLSRMPSPQTQAQTQTQTQAAAVPSTSPASTGYNDALYTSSSMPYSQIGYATAPMRSYVADDRRFSGYADAIEASQGILSLSQDTTPRAAVAGDGPSMRQSQPQHQQTQQQQQQRGPEDAYGFAVPPPHSNHSSVSSTGYNGFYPGGSMDSSMSDFSGTGSADLDAAAAASRTLSMGGGRTSVQTAMPPMTTTTAAAAANSYLASGGMLSLPPLPPAPAPVPPSMLTQFNTKMINPTQKKHKCKVCDKRFTRPSSLQTHVYSHTGERPFPCTFEGCGRRFSVVSNLRRHDKVHSANGRPHVSLVRSQAQVQRDKEAAVALSESASDTASETESPS